ncbi:hypothetical protein HMI55_001291 [Coelomomyces lativittatus]|nr:hypothetical protein HMI55_001291 [Coelomomyces lativittatus]
MVPMMLEASSTDQEQKQWEFPKLTEVLTEQGRAAGKLYVGQGTFGLGLIRLEFLNQPLRVAEKPWVQLKAWKPDWWPNQTLHS